MSFFLPTSFLMTVCYCRMFSKTSLTHFMQLVSFYPRKHHKIRIFQGLYIERPVERNGPTNILNSIVPKIKYKQMLLKMNCVYAINFQYLHCFIFYFTTVFTILGCQNKVPLSTCFSVY